MTAGNFEKLGIRILVFACVLWIAVAFSQNSIAVEHNSATPSLSSDLLSCYSQHIVHTNKIKDLENLSFLNPPTAACRSEVDNFVQNCTNNGEQLRNCQMSYAALWIALYAKESPDTMIAGWQITNDKCRDAIDKNMAEVICNVREIISTALEHANWCYGKNGEAMYQMNWHRCVSNSLK